MSGNGTSGNATTSPTEDDFQFRVVKIIFYFFILTCSTCGNTILIYIISSYKKMRTPSNILILNLALSDLLTPLLSIPFDFALEENSYKWMYGAIVCKVLWPLQTFSSTISSFILAAIALDRYRILMHPFTTRLTGKQIKWILLAIYVFCGVTMVPYGYVLELSDGGCGESWPAPAYRKAFTLFLFLIQYAIPLVLMIILYSMAVWNLCRARKKMRSSSVTGQDKKKNNKANGTMGRRLRRPNFGKDPNSKATKMFIIIVVVFAIFMFPNQAVWLWAEFGGGADKPIFPKLSIVCWLFTYTNSVVNPLIFRNFSKEFRSGFKIVLGQFSDRICLKRRSKQVERAREYLKGNVSTLNSTAAEFTARSDSNSSAIWPNEVKRQVGQNDDEVRSKSSVPPFDMSAAEGCHVSTGLAPAFENCLAALGIDRSLGNRETEDLLFGMENSPETNC